MIKVEVILLVRVNASQVKSDISYGIEHVLMSVVKLLEKALDEGAKSLTEEDLNMEARP